VLFSCGELQLMIFLACEASFSGLTGIQTSVVWAKGFLLFGDIDPCGLPWGNDKINREGRTVIWPHLEIFIDVALQLLSQLVSMAMRSFENPGVFKHDIVWVSNDDICYGQ
jgi:hypothetical protein